MIFDMCETFINTILKGPQGNIGQWGEIGLQGPVGNQGPEDLLGQMEWLGTQYVFLVYLVY